MGRRSRTGHAQDVDALKELLRSRRPAVIALGTRNLEIRRLEKEVQEIVKELGTVRVPSGTPGLTLQACG